MAERVGSRKGAILGLVSVLGSIYLGISLYTYSKWDPSFFTFTKNAAGNYGGPFGAYLSDAMITVIGFSAYAVPIFLLAYGARRVLAREPRRSYLYGTILFLFSLSVMVSLFRATFRVEADTIAGGLVGMYVSNLLERYLSLVGAYIVALSLFIPSIILISPLSAISLLSRRRPAKAAETFRKPEKGVLEEDILVKEPRKIDKGPVVADPLPAPTVLREFGEDKGRAPARTPAAGKTASGGYQLPSIDLLTQYDTSSIRPSKEELLSNSSLLESKIGDFDVEGRVTQVHPGPVVTLYEFEPAPGVKINRVVSLADDLALALKAQSMRVSPIPGKAAIGIEVPNKQREIVSLREIVSSEIFRKSHSKLTLALGKDIFGNPVVADLAKMPHLLVAGSTGAGKSVSINSMIMSILYKSTPAEVKMLMIDPKLLELSMYEDIPHLISPVITNPKRAAEALRKMVFEMERRYRLLAEKGARNIDSFNRQVSVQEQLPYIIVLIDELADLMFASSKEVEDSITRLAQMARAAGIHLIIATQRPSVDVITGLIKANFPARISFQVFSKIDSRTILDMQGAEQLLGKGDMLMMLPGSKIVRVHGALVTENEISGVTGFIKSQGTPDFSIFEEIPVEEETAEATSEERDEMYEKALEFAESAGEVSISSLQRRFKIGYNRAARIMEIMAEDGLVGPPKGAGKPRDFLRRHR